MPDPMPNGGAESPGYPRAQEFLTRERCYITELANTPSDPACSLAIARVPPGVTTERHALRGITERYVILEGTGRVEVGDRPPVTVGARDCVHIPADAPQQITNTGGVDLVFLCVCTPRFTPEAYVAIG